MEKASINKHYLDLTGFDRYFGSYKYTLELCERITRVFQFRMPSEGSEHYPVFTIRTNKPPPESKPKDAFYDWEGKRAFGDEGSLPTAGSQASLS